MSRIVFVSILHVTLLHVTFSSDWPGGPLSPSECGPWSLNRHGGAGLSSTCTGAIKDGPSKSFYVKIPSLPNITAVHLDVVLSVQQFLQPEAGTLKLNTTRLTALVGFGRTWTPLGRSRANVKLGSIISSSLMCFPPTNFDGSLKSYNVTMSVLSSAPIAFRLDLLSFLRLSGIELNTAAFGGSHHGHSALFSFTIADGDADLERIFLSRSSVGLRSGPVNVPELINAYIFSENNSCISPRIAASGCANPQEIIACLQSVDVDFSAGIDIERVGQHISFLSNTSVTLSQATVPPRSVGRWFVLFTCGLQGDESQRCPETRLIVETKAEYDVGKSVYQGWAFMFFMPLLMLVGVDLIYFGTYKILLHVRGSSEHAFCLWPAFVGLPDVELFRELKAMAHKLSGPQPFLASLLALMLAAFMSTAGQFVATHWWFMERTGDRDACFYNEACYYPSLGFSVPLNHMLSHLPYFIAGFHVIYQAAFARTRIRSYCKAYPESVIRYPLDLRAFHAIAGSFMAEGLGSACYHVCPSVETFQFDTCFMIPIAHLCSLALVDFPQGTDSHVTALKYFLYIITPIWMFNFIGTWYDIGAVRVDGYYVIAYYFFAAVVIVWSIFAVQALDIIFYNRVALETALDAAADESVTGSASEEEMGKAHSVIRHSRLIAVALKVFVVAVLAASMISEPFRASVGGMANTFLVLSIVVMMAAAAWQVQTLSIASRRFGSPVLWRTVVKLSYLILLVPLTYAALWCFQTKVANVMPGVAAAESRMENQPCVVSIFDLHDVWHLLSAVGIAMFAMMLLDVKIHTFARMNAIGLIDESGE